MGVLIDTCVWVDVERGRISPADVELMTGQEPVFISPVSIGELAFGVEMAVDESVRQKRAASLERLAKKPLLLIDEMTGKIFGKLGAVLKKQGKQHAHRIQDLWLASQAIQYNFRFLTENIKDFRDIPGLEMLAMKPPDSAGRG